MMKYERYKPGDLVEVLCDRTHSSDQLTTAFTCECGGVKLYAKIEIYSYPGYNEFTGEHVCMVPGSVANVVRFVGRPPRIRQAFDCWEYDIYEVLAEGHQVMMFANNMSPEKKKKTVS